MVSQGSREEKNECVRVTESRAPFGVTQEEGLK